MSEWETEKTATWVNFGPFTLQGTVAMVIRGVPTKATVSIFVATDHVEGLLVEQQIDGEPTLAELRSHALVFGMKWIAELSGEFNKILHSTGPKTFL
jgi:hypothetical protein